MYMPTWLIVGRADRSRRTPGRQARARLWPRAGRRAPARRRRADHDPRSRYSQAAARSRSKPNATSRPTGRRTPRNSRAVRHQFFARRTWSRQCGANTSTAERGQRATRPSSVATCTSLPDAERGQTRPEAAARANGPRRAASRRHRPPRSVRRRARRNSAPAMSCFGRHPTRIADTIDRRRLIDDGDPGPRAALREDPHRLAEQRLGLDLPIQPQPRRRVQNTAPGAHVDRVPQRRPVDRAGRGRTRPHRRHRDIDVPSRWRCGSRHAAV